MARSHSSTARRSPWPCLHGARALDIFRSTRPYYARLPCPSHEDVLTHAARWSRGNTERSKGFGKDSTTLERNWHPLTAEPIDDSSPPQISRLVRGGTFFSDGEPTWDGRRMAVATDRKRRRANENPRRFVLGRRLGRASLDQPRATRVLAQPGIGDWIAQKLAHLNDRRRARATLGARGSFVEPRLVEARLFHMFGGSPDDLRRIGETVSVHHDNPPCGQEIYISTTPMQCRAPSHSSFKPFRASPSRVRCVSPAAKVPLVEAFRSDNALRREIPRASTPLSTGAAEAA